VNKFANENASGKRNKSGKTVHANVNSQKPHI